MSNGQSYAAIMANDVGMQARDGIHLATDVWRPAIDGEALPGPFPAVLLRTPYGKLASRYLAQGKSWASHGYLFVIQDCRGRFDSEGDFVLLANEGPDGYDAVEWTASLPYCDGNVGTVGTSYSAWLQNALAIENPPHLKAMWINQGGSNGHRTALRHNGALELRWLTWAVTHGAASLANSDPRLAERLRVHGVEMFDWLTRLPWTASSPLSELPVYEEWARDLYRNADGISGDRYWSQTGLNFEPYLDQTSDVPTIYSGGWYDSYTRATTDMFTALSPRLEQQQLLMGPWTHGDASLDISFSGEVEFGPDASMASNPAVFPGGSRLGEARRWFDHWLKGTVDAPDDVSPVKIFVMGGGSGERNESGRIEHGGRWRSEQDWPLTRAVTTSLYLAADNKLTWTVQPGPDSSSTFVYDPNTPLPTIAANTSSLNEIVPTPRGVRPDTPISLMRVMVVQGGADQRSRAETLTTDGYIGLLQQRSDVLSFETAPLDADLEVTGPIEAVVHLSSDAPDTDLFVMVQDVYPASPDWPDGFRLNVTDSIMRVRYRDGFDRGCLMSDGEVVQVRFPLYPTSNLFAAGHSIAVLVSSSSFPRFDPNPNTGEPIGLHTHTRIATNTIHHSLTHPSRLELPIVT